MAGIFSDVSTDIQKLRQLKAEIENVKKALKGIDVNVKIDIAKGMEAQLQSLMKKYDALVKKVSEAEGKIMSSTKRINDASEKIIKAQEQLSKAAGMNTKPDNGNADVSLNNVGTANVQAQAKAYDELAKEIDSVMGTRSQNIKRMIDEQNAIRLINEEIKKLTKFQTGNSTLTNTQQKRLEQLNNSLLTHKAALSDVRQTLMNNVKLDNSATTSMNGISQSLSRMRIAYRELTEEERNSPFGKELLASIQQADAKIKELDATIGNHQRNVGNYAKGYNGLNMSVQQIVRELPSATMGLNMFFLAISNNLPILTDEIKRAKAANEELKTSGQKGVPVWKQVASSLFSWQSALMVGITLLTVHGDKVWEWIKSIFKGKDVLDEVKESQEDINKRLEEENRVRKSAAQSVSSLLTEYKKLQVEYKSLNGSVQKQNKFIKDNQDEFRKLGVSVNDVTDAENLFIKNETAFITSLQHRAMAAAAMAQMETEYKKVIDRMVEMEDYIASGGNNESINMAQGITDNYIASLLKQKGVINSTQSAYPYIDLIKQGKWQSNKDLQGTGIDWSKEYNAYYQNQLSMLVGAEAADRFNRQTEESQKKIETLAKVVRKESEAAKESLDEAGLDEYVTTNDNDKQKQEQEKLYDQLLQLRFKNQQDEINLMKDGAEKKRKQLELDYQKEYAETLALEKKWMKLGGGKLSMEQQVEISRKYTNAENKFNSGIAALEGGFSQEELNASMNKYLAAYGTYVEKRNAIIAQATANKEGKNEWEQKSIDEETKRALSEFDIEAKNNTSAISHLFGDMRDKTLNDLQQINAQGQAALAFLKSGEWDEDKGKQFGISQETFELWSKSPDKLKDISDALRDNKEAADELRPAYDKVADGLNKVFNSGNDTKKLKEGLSDIQDGMNDIMQIGSFLSDTFSSLGDAFGSDTLSGVADGINVAMDAMNSAMQGAQAGSMFGPIGAAAGAAIGLVTSLASSIAKIHDAKNEKRIQTLQDQIDVLDKSYEKLGDSIEKAYSKDASNLIDQQNKLLEQQKILIQQQIREEQDKKKTDDERIKEWQQQIEDINKLIEDNKEAAVDAIFGEDLKSAIDDFASAYAEAWANGENRAESAKETVKSMMRQMVTESIKAAMQSSGAMEKIRQKLQEFYSDNVLSSWEQDYIYSMAEELQKELDRQFGWADSLMKDEEDKEQQSASSRGFGTEMTHEDAGELSGRFTAVYESNLRIETATQQQTVAITELRGSISALTSQVSGMYNIADETRTILANSYLELQQIRENTGEIVKPIKQIQADIAEVKRNTSRL